MTSPLIQQPEFQALLPWAKAYARAELSPLLGLAHFACAAWLQLEEKRLDLPQDLVSALQPWAGRLPKVSAPVHETMKLTPELKAALGREANSNLVDWLRQIVAPSAAQEVHAPNLSDCEVWPTLVPWLRGAVQAHEVQHITLPSLAQGILSAVHAKALQQHEAFEHLCLGHADELQFWLEHTGQLRPNVQAVPATGNDLQVSDEVCQGLRNSATKEHSPSAAWDLLHAAVGTANRYSRLLQVAYHEAGHAVALHVLTPETSFKTVSIEQTDDAAGHIAPTRNEAFDSVYQHSLEYAREQVVALLAGRAAEEKRFGKQRVDSGALGDFAHASRLAWIAITAFGQDPVFGPVNLAAVQSLAKHDDQHQSDATASGWLQDLAQQRLHAWLKWGSGEAHRLIEAHWHGVEAMALALMQKRTLSDQDVRRLLSTLNMVGFCLTELPE